MTEYQGYQAAVELAAASHGLASADRPLFVNWVSDAFATRWRKHEFSKKTFEQLSFVTTMFHQFIFFHIFEQGDTLWTTALSVALVSSAIFLFFGILGAVAANAYWREVRFHFFERNSIFSTKNIVFASICTTFS